MTRRTIFAGLVGTWLAACSTATPNVAPGDNTAECTSDDECASGTCQFGLCAGPGDDAPFTVALAISPPDFRPDLVPQQTTGVQVSAGRQLPDFRLSTPVLLSGFVSYDNGVPVDADVRFRAVNGVPGLQFVANARTEAGGGVITATVPPGRYDVTVIPDRDDVPRTVLRDQLISTDSPDDCPANAEAHCEFLQFVVPSAERYRALSGVVERRETRITPVTGARIYATSTDGRFESTHALTSDDGSFLVFLAPDADEVIMHVRAGDDATLPDYEFVPLTVPDRDAIEGLVLSLGDWVPPVAWRVEVTTPTGTPATDALVTLRASHAAPDFVDATAIPIASSSTDLRLSGDDATAPGVFDFSVRPGDWTLSGASLSGDWGPARPETVMIGEGSGSTSIALVAPRPVIGRVVAAATGDAVTGAQVELAARSSGGSDVAQFGISPSMLGTTVVTDGEGRFEAELVPGIYDATIVPPESSGLARTRAELDFETSAWAVATLDMSGVVLGRVLDRDGEPLPGASVEAWSEGDERAQLLARGVTDIDGTYRLLLPLEAR